MWTWHRAMRSPCSEFGRDGAEATLKWLLLQQGHQLGSTRLCHHVGGHGVLRSSETAVSALSIKKVLEMRVRGLGLGAFALQVPCLHSETLPNFSTLYSHYLLPGGLSKCEIKLLVPYSNFHNPLVSVICLATYRHFITKHATCIAKNWFYQS